MLIQLEHLTQISWAGRGKNLTVPTLNFQIPKELEALDFWVYAGVLIANEQAYSAAIHYGPIPTFSDTTPRFEVNLIDISDISFSPDTEFAVTFIEKIRDIRTFPNPETLKMQILQDIEQIQKILAKK